MKSDLLQCEVEVWHKTYAPFATSWPQDSLDRIIAHLTKKKLLNDSGWVDIQTARSLGKNEGAVLSCLNRIVEQIAAATMGEETAAKNGRQCTAASCPRFRTDSDKVGYLSFPDLRSVHRPILEGQPEPSSPPSPSAEQQRPNDEAERNNLSTETFDTAIVGEFKLADKPEDKVDVSSLMSSQPGHWTHRNNRTKGN